MQTTIGANAIGRDDQLVTFENPDPPVADGEGGYTQTWTALVPATWYVRIRPASARDAERVTAGTVVTHLSHVIHGRSHPGVSTLTRMVWRDPSGVLRTFQITSVATDARDREMELVADLQA